MLDAVILLVPILIIPFIYSGSLIDPALLPRFLAFATYLLAFLLLLMRQGSSNNISQGFGIISNKFFQAYFALVLISGVSLFYTSNFADGLFEWLKLILGFTFLMLLVVRFQDSPLFFSQLSKIISVFSLIASLIGLTQLMLLAGDSVISHTSVYNISSAFAHKNLYAQIILFTLPFTAYTAISFKGTFRIIGLTALILAFCSITISLSRGVWLATGLAIILTFALAYFLERKRSDSLVPLKVKAIGGICVLATIIGTILIYSYLDSFETIQRQVGSIFNSEHSATKDRLQMWDKSYQLFRENPLSGQGLGSWKVEILKFGTEGLRSTDGVTFFQRPHNDFIWTLTETGIFGFLAHVAIFLICFYYLLRILKVTENVKARRIYYLLFMSLVSYLLCSMFSFPKERIEHIIVLSLIMAPIIIAYGKINSERVNKSRWVSTGLPILALILGLSLLVGTKRAIAEYYTSQVMESRAKGDWKGTIENCTKAESAFYKMDPISTPISWYRGLANYNLGFQEEAFLQFQNAHKIHPYHIHVLNNLATSYEILGNHHEAIKYYKKAVNVNPHYEDVLLNLSVVLYQQGNTDEAYQFIRNVDPRSTNPKFKTLLKLLLVPRLKAIQNQLEEKILKLTVNRILFSDEWMKDIHAKSVKNKRSFSEQLLIDIFYTLTIEDETLTLDEAKPLKAKYNKLFL